MCKISIVLAVYNAEKTLYRALMSAIGQTLRDIEIICVDDASTDNTGSILRMFAQKDQRVRIIWHQRNEGTLMTRKHGIECSTGKYLMFLDPDDSLAENACEVLYSLIQRKNVDILQFRAEVVPATPDVPSARIKETRKRLEPPYKQFSNKELFFDVYCREKYWHVLWNKIYKTELCQKAVSQIEELYLVLRDDQYLFGMIAYFANSFASTKKHAKLYKYYFGSGISTKLQIDLDDFKMICSAANAAKAMHEFLLETPGAEKYLVYCENHSWDALKDACRIWGQQLETSQQSQGFDLLISHWEDSLVVTALREEGFLLRSDVVRGTAQSTSIRPRAIKSIHTIGVYYPKLGCGGAERVISLLIKRWSKDYSVVFFTEKTDEKDAYDLPKKVRRIWLPPEEDKERYRVLRRSVIEFGIDIFIYSAWLNRNLLWDVLSVKLCSVPCVINAHSPIQYWKEWFSNELDYSECLSSVQIADGVVTLSEHDARYWRAHKKQSKCILNPCDPSLLSMERASLHGSRILWVGRISREKRLEDAIIIFNMVAAQIPEAELVVVGDGDDEEYKEQINNLVKISPSRDRIHMEGYVNDPYPLYQNATLLLLTSEFEGFSMTILEAKSVGLPCVAYDLPNMYFMEEKCGIVAVEKGNTTQMADKIVELLKDREKLQTLSQKAFESFQRYINYNCFEEWSGFVAELVSASQTGELCQKENDPLRQNIMAVRQIRAQIYEQDVRRALRLVGIHRQYLNSSLNNRIKIIAKLAMSLFRIKVRFHDENYNIIDRLTLMLKRLMSMEESDKNILM